jgi:hypothetical protein
MLREGIAKLALRSKFGDREAGSIFREVTISEDGIGTSRKIEPAKRGRIWTRIGVLQFPREKAAIPLSHFRKKASILLQLAHYHYSRASCTLRMYP